MAEIAGPTTDPKLHKLLLSLGLLYSVIVTARNWGPVAPQQAMWPFPGLYFLELTVLPALAAHSAFQSWRQRTRIACVSGGAVFSFALLGAWSVGVAYVPLALLLLAGAFVSRLSTRDTPANLIAVALLSGGIQAIAMLGLASSL